MNRARSRFGLIALALSAPVVVACQSGPDAPPRFSAETYDDCAAIKRAWEPDYAQLAKRRFARGQNVFLYKSPPGGGLALYGGLGDAQGNVSEVARAAIAKGGSWGVTYPDTGCPDISADVDEHYIERYNRVALALYAARR